MLWVSQGFTHLHYGAIRLALSYHGRKGLPVVARLALLDTRYLEYQHACIGTIETTLNAGTVFVTLFPNFNMALSDPRLLTALKVQLQITGAPQHKDSVAATLHYQVAYRVQNHALDLSLPGSEEALMISVDSPTRTFLRVSMFLVRSPDRTLSSSCLTNGSLRMSDKPRTLSRFSQLNLSLEKGLTEKWLLLLTINPSRCQNLRHRLCSRR